MLRVKAFEVEGNQGVRVIVKSDEFKYGEGGDISYILARGILESYMEGYGQPAGECLDVLLLDAFYEDLEVLPFLDEGAIERFESIASQASKRMKWQCDRDALLSAVTIDPDDSDSWISKRAVLAEKAQGYKRLKEERQADEFISAMPTEHRRLPRRSRPVSTSRPVESGITFVP